LQPEQTEQVFDTLADVALAERAVASATPEKLRELAGKAAPVTLAGERTLPVVTQLEPLFPDGGLRRGSTIAVTGSLGLALAVLAGPSQAGAWCAAVGLPSLGVVAAAEAGVDLARFPMVADTGDDWATVAAALLDAFDIVLLSEKRSNRRLVARARERGAVLVVTNDWEGADMRLTVAASEWEGLGDGHGHLVRRRLEVVAGGRRAAARERRAEVWLP
jgi:hypothetical protein